MAIKAKVTNPRRCLTLKCIVPLRWSHLKKEPVEVPDADVGQAAEKPKEQNCPVVSALDYDELRFIRAGRRRAARPRRTDPRARRGSPPGERARPRRRPSPSAAAAWPSPRQPRSGGTRG